MLGKGNSMTIYLALHEERYPLAAFSTRKRAEEWIAKQAEKPYTFSIEVLTVDAPSTGA